MPTSSTCPDGDAEGDVIEAGQVSSDNHTSGRRIVFASKAAIHRKTVCKSPGFGGSLITLSLPGPGEERIQLVRGHLARDDALEHTTLGFLTFCELSVEKHPDHTANHVDLWD